MPETLPGDPTEAGPDARTVADERDWHDLESDAIGELQFAMRRYGYRTKCDIALQRAVNAKAINLLMDADAILKGMQEAIRG